MSRFHRHILISCIALLLVTGCRDFGVDSDGDEASNMAGDGVATLNEPFELQFGQRVILNDTDLTVEFSLVTEDNRCTDSVECIQAGRAGVLLTVTDSQFVRYQLVAYMPGLVATPYQNNDIIQFQGFRFRLLQVDPYPVEGADRDVSEYSVLLVIEPVNVN